MVKIGTVQARCRGFHSLEVITSVAIAVIVMVIGFSGFRIYSNEMPVKSECRQMTHVMGTARSMAISRNSFYAFRIDLDELNYWVDEVPDPNDPSAVPIANSGKKLESTGVDRRVRIEGVRKGTALLASTGYQEVIFGPDGSADADFRIILYEAGDDPLPDDNVYTVRVYGPTGLARIFPHERN